MASMHNPCQDIGAYSNSALSTTGADADPSDPLDLGRHRRSNVTKSQLKSDYPNSDGGKLQKFYVQQNKLIDQFLGAEDEERLQVEEDARMGPRIKLAVNASFLVNFGLFIIQVYAAASTGSLSVDLVSSFIIWITSRVAAQPNVYKYPVGRTRIETIGIILFCSLLTTVAVELLIESIRTLAAGGRGSEQLQIIPLVFVGVAIFAKSTLMVYCFFYRRYPSVHVFFIDHRNDILVNSFGLTLSIVGKNRDAWFADPTGAIIIALIILFSWVSNAFEQVWLLVGRSAPADFVSKLIYLAMTHDSRILKVDTCRAYHAGQRYYVEVDIIMHTDTPLRISHDVSQSLQRKFEGLSDVERAFVHVDYECDHDPYEEHKKLYKVDTESRSLKDRLLFWRRPQ
ncbi:cation efflux family-domain-containing protein [Xylaria bambusicola]|uniref:cation efflux family-domain-containing protein n=1 Tax=Xylaria bambusicola TaxID=326684 RepID=UPI002007D95F|nr:cation efflux family-domain-containing protein [Xylaria bambusicola]KAI0509662.1 cation efflux family-domain-containing protein [Xylaria bambusicola]